MAGLFDDIPYAQSPDKEQQKQGLFDDIPYAQSPDSAPQLSFMESYLKRREAQKQEQGGNPLDSLVADKSKGLTWEDLQSYGQKYAPPEGMVLNPKTGQMEDLTSPINPNTLPGGAWNAAMLGAGQGAGFNLLDEAAAGASAATKWWNGENYGDAYNFDVARMREAERRAAEDYTKSYYGGMVGGALGTSAGMAVKGMSLAANAAKAGWKLPAVAAASGVEGYGLGGLYGFGSGEGLEDRLEKSETGSKWGALFGAGTPFALAGLGAAARRAISPFRVSPEKLAAAEVLEREGVQLTAGQKTGSKALRYSESELGGGKAEQMMEDQGRAFTDAAMRKAGGSGLADPENLATLKSTLGQGFDDIASRNTLRADQGLTQDIRETLNRYGRLLETQQKPIINNIASDILARLGSNNGRLAGSEYQVIRSDLSTAAKQTSNETLSGAFRGFRNALDKAMERSINPADAGRWGELRRQYGNFKVVQKAANGAGEDAGIGVISPARLRMAASSGNVDNFTSGNSDFTKLAKAAQAIMTPLPNSGTARRIGAHGLFAGLAAGGGALAGGPTGLAAGLAAPLVAGRTLMSKPVQAYLSNQFAAGEMSPLTRAIMTAIMTGESAALSGLHSSQGGR